MRRTWMSLVVVVIATGLLVGSEPAGVAAPHAAPAARAQVLHRVVWDAAVRRDGPALDLRSAELDGSDERRIYRRQRGWILDLTMDPSGRRVAFTPSTPRSAPAKLLVVDVLSGAHRNLLRGERRIAIVGGIGWSPDGRSLVFEGFHGEGDDWTVSLWTIRRDGSGLSLLRDLGSPDPEEQDGVVSGNQLSWTAAGVGFLHGEGLWRLRDGRARLVLAGARRQYVAGDGRHVFVETFRGRRAVLWRIRPDGSGRRRVIASTRPHPRLGYLTGHALEHSGRRMLTTATGTTSGPSTILHPSSRPPRPSDPVVGFLDGVFTVAWN